MNDATTPQKDYILSLLSAREVAAELRKTIDAGCVTLTKVEASMVINSLKNAPYASKVSFSAAPTTTGLASLPKSFYAIPAAEANLAMTNYVEGGELLFVQVREYMSTRYIRRLTGSVGGFTRHKLDRVDEKGLIALLGTDSLRFITLFGQHYSVCGKCSAELTDTKSRASGFGPECRKTLGL